MKKHYCIVLPDSAEFKDICHRSQLRLTDYCLTIVDEADQAFLVLSFLFCSTTSVLGNSLHIKVSGFLQFKAQNVLFLYTMDEEKNINAKHIWEKSYHSIRNGCYYRPTPRVTFIQMDSC